MLTLASNERIPLKHYMRMIFEIRDLKYATPATVSRAGILYISTDGGSQWRSIGKFIMEILASYSFVTSFRSWQLGEKSAEQSL